jgi:oligopeptide transport system substrate-binding protein
MAPSRWLRSAAVGSLFSILLVACGTATTTSEQLAPDDKQILRLAERDEVPTLDPGLMEDNVSIDYGQNIFSGLLRFDEKTLKPVPEIANAMPKLSSDGKTYTFTLRKDAKFSNGDAITAADFKWSWERALDPKLAGPYTFVLDPIKGAADIKAKPQKSKTLSGVVVKDDYTLEVTLTDPANYFPSLAALWTYWVVDRKVVEGKDKWADAPNNGGNLVGSGPYKLTEWKHDQSLTLEAVPNWWGATASGASPAQPQPKIKKVTIEIIKDQSAQVSKYETAGLDSVTKSLAQADILRVQQDPKLKKELTIYPQLRVTWVGFNMTKGPFSTNKKLRQAFCQAVDKKKLEEIALVKGAQGKAATSQIPPGMPGHLDDPDPYPFDKTLAKNLLKEADPDGSLTRDLTYWFNASEFNKKIAENLQSQWQENLGINVKLQSAPWKEFLKRRHGHEFQFNRGSWGADFPDPWDFIDPIDKTGGDDNDEGYSSPEVDRLLKESVAATDPKVALDKLNQAQRVYLKDLPSCQLFWGTVQYLIKPYVKGFGANPEYMSKWYNVSITQH